MARLVVLLRGVNLVKHNRVSMPLLRDALTDAGFEDVATYVQSGNVVLTTTRKPPAVGKSVAAVIDDRFGLDIDVVVRTRAELAKVVERNPLGSVVDDPKRYQVTFLGGDPGRAAVEKLETAVADDERFVRHGREVYAWYPTGSHGSKLARILAGAGLGVTATSRNWSTVTALLALADET